MYNFYRKTFFDVSKTIFHQAKLFLLIYLIPGALYEVKTGILKIIKNILYFWKIVLGTSNKVFFEKIREFYGNVYLVD